MLPGMVSCANRYCTTVESVRPLAKDTWGIRIAQPQLAEVIRPGQFFMVKAVGCTDPLLGRPFALFDTFEDSDGQPAGVDFGFVVVGKLTGIMSQWQAGTAVEIWGPLGNGFPPASKKHLICVAGGIGQTPFLAVAREALGLATYGTAQRTGVRPESVTLCYGVRSEEYAAGLKEFDLPGLDVQLATDDGSAGHHGLVTELLQKQLQKAPEDSEVYCCGPEPMMKAVSDICIKAGVDCLLSLETPMACGFGACFSCVAKVKDADGWDYKRTCVEGPVFKAEELIL